MQSDFLPNRFCCMSSQVQSSLLVRPWRLGKKGAINPDCLSADERCRLTGEEDDDRSNVRHGADASHRGQFRPGSSVIWIFLPRALRLDRPGSDTVDSNSVAA